MSKGTEGRGGITIALIYTRVSSDDQAREGVSLDAQLSECRRYAARQGWIMGNEYQDVLSGTRDDRPQYQALLSDVRRRRAERAPVAVVVAKLDRFGRRLLERVRCREELKGLGVPVHSVREGGEVSDLVANILASVAQEEVRQLGERVAAVRRHVAANGWRPVGTTPWGYRWRPATDEERRQGAPKSVLAEDPETAPYVRRAWEMAAEGATSRAVLRWVTALPSDARGGRTLGHSAVQKMLRMPVYIARQEGTDGGDALGRPARRWPALIDDATWAAVQRRLGDHRRMPRQATGSYLLTGLVHCPRCDARMCGWQAGSRSARYRCERKAPTCGGDAMASPVDAGVLTEIGDVLAVIGAADPELHAAVRREWRALQQPTADKAGQVRGLERSADKARQRLTSAAVLFADGEIDRTGYRLLRDKATSDLEAADAELTRLRGIDPAPVLPPLDDVLHQVGGWSATLATADVPAMRDVLGVLIDTVVPVRLGVGRYAARIAWTPAGEAIRQAATALASAA